MKSVESTILDLNGGWHKDIESVSLVERFPVSLNVAEIGSRVVRSHLQDLQACVHLERSIFTLKVKIIVKKPQYDHQNSYPLNIFFSAITKDILGSFLMTVRPAEIILPSFFQINVLHIMMMMMMMVVVMMTIIMMMMMMMMMMVIVGMLMVVTSLQDSLQHILVTPCPPPQP